MDFKIICWNLRDLNDLNKIYIINQKARVWKPSILLLQETKLQQCNDFLVWQTWGNKNFKWLDAPSEGRSGVLLCCWDDSKIKFLDSLVGHYSINIICQMCDTKFECIFTGVYAPNSNNIDERKLFWREIEEVISYWDLPWVLGGDFNEFRFTYERYSGWEITAGMRKFNKLISRHELIDLPLNGASFTWTNSLEAELTDF